MITKEMMSRSIREFLFDSVSINAIAVVGQVDHTEV